MPKFFQNTLVLGSTLLVTLLGVEIFLRWLMPVDYRRPASELPGVGRDIIYQASTTPGLDYELVPNIHTRAHNALVTTNSYGMRSAEPDPARPHKIVVLGDSFSFGFKIEQGEMFSTRLDAALAGAGRDENVLNMAVSGYALKDEVATLKHKALAFEPDIIIIGYVMNDPEIEPIQQIPAYFRTAEWWQYSHVLRLFAQAAKRLETFYWGDGNYYRYLHAHPASWQSVVDGFAEIQRLAQVNNSRVILLIFPDLWFDWAAYPYQDIHRQVAAEAEKNGFEVIDLADVFSAYPPGELRVSTIDAHPNALANRLVFEALLQALSQPSR